MCRVAIQRSPTPNDKIKVDMTFDEDKSSVNITVTRPPLVLSEEELNKHFSRVFAARTK